MLEIYRGEHFTASHNAEYPIPGFVVLSSNRLVVSLDELTNAEAMEYFALTRKIRMAQREVLRVRHAFQVRRETAQWILPRHEWMKPFGESVDSALDYARTNFAASSEARVSVARTAQALRERIRSLV